MITSFLMPVHIGNSNFPRPGRGVMGIIILITLFVLPAPAQVPRNVVVGTISCIKNNTTKKSIIVRELPFQTGDTVPLPEFGKRVAQSIENLLNTALFNFVTVDTAFEVTGDYRMVSITYSFVERWYLWPTPILEISDRNINTWFEKRDFSRLNYGAHLLWYNVTGRMENLDVTLRLGMNQQFSMLLDIPYLDKHKKIGAGLEAGYMRNREEGYITENDKLNFSFNNNYHSRVWFAALHLLYRGSIHYSHLLDIGFRRITFSDSLLKLNPHYFSGRDFTCSYPSVYYKFKADFRDARYYPLKGWYVDAEISQSGFGPVVSSLTDGWIKSTSRVYSRITRRWYAGAGIIARISTLSDDSYFMNTALGYNRDFVRGYEYYVVDGTHFGILKTSLKFAMVPQRTSQFRFIPSEKFGLVHYAAYLTWFGDAGYVVPNEFGNNNNQLPGTWLLGTGFGLDLVTYYDKVMRLEVALNRKGEAGVYIHLIAGL